MRRSRRQSLNVLRPLLPYRIPTRVSGIWFQPLQQFLCGRNEPLDHHVNAVFIRVDPIIEIECRFGGDAIEEERT